jgi:hypothetical protein
MRLASERRLMIAPSLATIRTACVAMKLSRKRREIVVRVVTVMSYNCLLV